MSAQEPQGGNICIVCLHPPQALHTDLHSCFAFAHLDQVQFSCSFTLQHVNRDHDKLFPVATAAHTVWLTGPRALYVPIYWQIIIYRLKQTLLFYIQCLSVLFLGGMHQSNICCLALLWFPLNCGLTSHCSKWSSMPLYGSAQSRWEEGDLFHT